MDASLVVLAILLLALLVWSVSIDGPNTAVRGLRTGLDLFIAVLPQMIVGFALAGLIMVLLPSEAVVRWAGADSGFTGLSVATAAGILTPGGPFLQFPILGALAQAGVAPGPLVAYLTAWSLISANRSLVWELPILGFQFTLVRWAVSLVVPVLVGQVVAMLIPAWNAPSPGR